MTRKKEYLWVVRMIDAPMIYRCRTGSEQPPKDKWAFPYAIAICEEEATRVFGSFRIGEVKRFSIPLKPIRGKK